MASSGNSNESGVVKMGARSSGMRGSGRLKKVVNLSRRVVRPKAVAAGAIASRAPVLSGRRVRGVK